MTGGKTASIISVYRSTRKHTAVGTGLLVLVGMSNFISVLTLFNR